MREIITPITEKMIEELKVGETILLSGEVFCGRDSVLPRIVNSNDDELNAMLKGSVIFHTAVSRAGLGPTSSNKAEIESSIVPLSRKGVKMHLGKGRISDETIKGMDEYKSSFAVIAPVTALLEKRTLSKEVVAYDELGMEAFYKITVDKYPIIIAAVHGESIFDDR